MIKAKKKDRDCGSSGYSLSTCGKIQSGGIHEGGKGKAGRAERRDGSGEEIGEKISRPRRGTLSQSYLLGEREREREEEEERRSEVTGLGCPDAVMLMTNTLLLGMEVQSRPKCRFFFILCSSIFFLAFTLYFQPAPIAK